MVIMLCTCFTQDVQSVNVVLELLAWMCDDQNATMQDLLNQQDDGVSYILILIHSCYC